MEYWCHSWRVKRLKSNNSSPKATKQPSYTIDFKQAFASFACFEYVVLSFVFSLHLFYRSCLPFFVLFTCFRRRVWPFSTHRYHKQQYCFMSMHSVLDLLFLLSCFCQPICSVLLHLSLLVFQTDLCTHGYFCVLSRSKVVDGPFRSN